MGIGRTTFLETLEALAPAAGSLPKVRQKWEVGGIFEFLIFKSDLQGI